jgi:hypothetical protein
VLGPLAWDQAWSQELEARLDRSRVVEGESVVLILESTGDIQGSPDLTPLTADFDLLDQAQSTRFTSVNGRLTSSRQWRLVLAPKRTGNLTIPPVQIGGARSPSLPLEVVAAAEADQEGGKRPFLVEVEAEPQEPYVQAAIRYTVRVLSSVSLRQASLSEPSAGDAIVQRLDEDIRYRTVRGGKRYDVVERRYGVFPQHSGSLTIEGPVLSASVPVERPRGQGSRQRALGYDPFAGFPDLGGWFTETRPVQIRARGVTLEVQPQPAGSPTPWLPAKSFSMDESWSPDPPQFRVGEPVTRTITLTARGLTDVQLPDVTPAADGGLKVYADQPQGETQGEGGDIVATKVLKAALVPTQPGELTLRELRVPWWDTATNQPRVAVLPERTAEVLPTAAETGSPATRGSETRATGPAAGPSVPAAGSPANVPQAKTLPSPTQAPGGGASSAAGYYWPWAAGGLGLAWMLTAGLWLRELRRRQFPVKGGSTVGEQRRRETIKSARARVERACRSADLRAARDGLLAWADARWPDDPPRGLAALARRLGPGPAREALLGLDRSLYDATEAPWDGMAAWAALGPALGSGDTRQHPDRGPVLPQLYPSATSPPVR